MSDIHVGIIGGSGLGEALVGEDGQKQTVDTPFGPPSSPIMTTRWKDVPVAVLQRHGPGHRYNPSDVPYRANIFALKKLGVTHIIASGATGSLREEIRPGDLVIVDQTIDKTYRRPNTFYDDAAVHVELADPFCSVMRQWLLAAAERLDGVTVHPKGTYVCMEGPAFSTRAESQMHRAWGGDVIGMTACPEAKLAREAEIAYALIALPTDYDCWRPAAGDQPQHELLKEIIENLQRAAQHSIALIKAAFENLEALRNPSLAHSALNLAIWSNKEMLDREPVERLGVLWGKYFTTE